MNLSKGPNCRWPQVVWRAGPKRWRGFNRALPFHFVNTFFKNSTMCLHLSHTHKHPSVSHLLSANRHTLTWCSSTGCCLTRGMKSTSEQHETGWSGNGGSSQLNFRRVALKYTHFPSIYKIHTKPGKQRDLHWATTEPDGRVCRRLTPRSPHSWGWLLILLYSRAQGAALKPDKASRPNRAPNLFSALLITS